MSNITLRWDSDHFSANHSLVDRKINFIKRPGTFAAGPIILSVREQFRNQDQTELAKEVLGFLEAFERNMHGDVSQIFENVNHNGVRMLNHGQGEFALGGGRQLEELRTSSLSLMTDGQYMLGEWAYPEIIKCTLHPTVYEAAWWGYQWCLKGNQNV